MTQNRTHAVMAQRHEAKALGLPRYFTGTPCPRRHVAERLVANWTCIACINEKARERRAENPEAARQADRESYHRNIERNRALLRKGRAKHMEKRRAYDRQRYADPDRRERQLAQAKQWAKDNPAKRVKIVAQRRTWVKRATPQWLTSEHRQQIAAFYNRARSSGRTLHVDHIVPLRGRNVCGLNVPWNLQLLPGAENLKKGNSHEA